jgi:hypothetical protein
LCGKDITQVCHCKNTIKEILICTKTPNDHFSACQTSLATGIAQWNAWVEQIKGAVWKLPIPLDMYQTAFKKNVEIYREKLEAVHTMNSKGYFLQEMPLFDWVIPNHVLARHKKKLYVISTRFQEFVEKYHDKPWNWTGLSWNPNVTLEWVEKYIDKPWDWSGLSRNPNVTLEWVEKYPDKLWNWVGLSRNHNITLEQVEKYPDKPWNWDGLSQNPNVTLEWLEKYIDKPWNWRWLSQNPNITLEQVEKYHDKPWSWYGLSRNLFELN